MPEVKEKVRKKSEEIRKRGQGVSEEVRKSNGEMVIGDEMIAIPERQCQSARD